MGASYYVAVHQENWPSAAAVNECLANAGYPVRIIPSQDSEDMPLGENDGSLTVGFEDKQVELEASITQLSATNSFAYALKVDNARAAEPNGADDFVPLGLNSELKKLGMEAPSFEYGDYVLTLTFRTSVAEWKAGFLLMSGLIRCSNGLGFEFAEASYGGVSFADKLFLEASEME